MQSNNPVFRRSPQFNRSGGNAYGNQMYAGNGSAYPGYGYTDPSTWSVGTPGQPTQPLVDRAPMTVDSVVQKTAISVGVVMVAAALTWLLTPDVSDPTANLGPLVAAVSIGSLGALVLSMVNSFKRVISPVLVLAFAALQGIALGGFSKVIDAAFATDASGNIVVQAVVGTFAAFGGTLATYKFMHVRVGDKFRTFVMAAMWGLFGLAILELVLGLFGASFGIFGFGTIGLLFALGGLVVGVFMLILDFDFVEQGIANRLPERESWRAAFAMTVSLVWIYTNLLRVLAILQQD